MSQFSILGKVPVNGHWAVGEFVFTLGPVIHTEPPCEVDGDLLIGGWLAHSDGLSPQALSISFVFNAPVRDENKHAPWKVC